VINAVKASWHLYGEAMPQGACETEGGTPSSHNEQRHDGGCMGRYRRVRFGILPGPHDRPRASQTRLGVAVGVFLSCVLGSPSAEGAHGPTLTVTADTTLAADLTGHIVIAMNGVTLDCDGHVITGPGASDPFSTPGVRVRGRTGATVKNCAVTNFPTVGILVDGSTNGLLLNNRAVSNQGGFAIQFSSGHTVVGNSAIGNHSGFQFVVSDTTITGNSTGDDGESGFVLQFSSSNTLTDNVADGGAAVGFEIESSGGNVFTANTVQGYQTGFLVRGSLNVLAGNSARSNRSGFIITEGFGNSLTGNVANGNVEGFDVTSSSDNSLTGNSAEANADGLVLVLAAGNAVTENTFASNERAIRLCASLIRPPERAIPRLLFSNTLTDNGRSFSVIPGC